jgi:hypothetical protein
MAQQAAYRLWNDVFQSSSILKKENPRWKHVFHRSSDRLWPSTPLIASGRMFFSLPAF